MTAQNMDGRLSGYVVLIASKVTHLVGVTNTGGGIPLRGALPVQGRKNNVIFIVDVSE